MSRRWFPAWIVPLLSLVDFSLWWCDGTVGSWWIATWLLILLLAQNSTNQMVKILVMSQWCQWCLETSWNRSLVWAGRAKNLLLLCMVLLIKPWQWIHPGQRTTETRPQKVEQISTTVPKVEQIWTDWTVELICTLNISELTSGKPTSTRATSAKVWHWEFGMFWNLKAYVLGSPSRNFSCDPGHSFGFKRSPRRQSYQANVWHQGDEMLSNAVSSSWAFSLALLVLRGCRWQIWQLRPARASILPPPCFCDIMWHPFVETTGWSNLAKLSGVQSVILARHMLDVRKLREAHLEDDASKFSKSDWWILKKILETELWHDRTMAWHYGTSWQQPCHDTKEE